MSAQQQALLLPVKQGKFEVKPHPIPKPEPGEILVKIEAAALNPVDHFVQDAGFFIENYPAIVGWDGAGVVTEVGEGVTTFKKGDRTVFGGFIGDKHATFQQYATVPAEIAGKIPENISFDEAATIPTGVFTAILPLYNKHQVETNQSVGLVPFWEEGGLGKYSGEPIVVLGGASSVGQFAIQSAKNSGFSPIIATASPHNAPWLTSLGATHILDRRLKPSELAAEVAKITSAPLKHVYDAVGVEETQNAGYDLLASGGYLIAVHNSAVAADKLTPDKKVITTFGSAWPPASRVVGVTFWAKVEKLLKEGLIKPNRVEVLPGGLAGIVGGLDKLRSGKVSGVKLVAHPQE